MRRFLNIILFMATLLAGAARAEDTKHAQIRKLQILSRVYQICYGRALKQDEAKEVLALSRQEIIDRIIKSDELAKVFAARLVAFTKAGDSGSNAAALEVPATVRQIARPTSPLDAVLKNLKGDRHKGVACGDKPNTVCFAQWLVGRVAPSLGAEWVQKNEAGMATWTYAKLLEQLASSSL